MPMGDPGDHPGVSVVPLTDDTTATAAAITVALTAKQDYVFQYSVGGSSFAVFASKY